MKIILSKNVSSLTGCLDPDNGFHIQSKTLHDGTKVFYTSLRNHRQKLIPYDAHWQFIRLLAGMADRGTYIADIILPRGELFEALHDAGQSIPPLSLHKKDLHADDINALIHFYNL
jgi:hypothetical protein